MLAGVSRWLRLMFSHLSEPYYKVGRSFVLRAGIGNK